MLDLQRFDFAWVNDNPTKEHLLKFDLWVKSQHTENLQYSLKGTIDPILTNNAVMFSDHKYLLQKYLKVKHGLQVIKKYNTSLFIELQTKMQQQCINTHTLFNVEDDSILDEFFDNNGYILNKDLIYQEVFIKNIYSIL